VARGLGRIGAAALAGLGETLLKAAIAYVLAVVIGVGGGILLGSVRSLRQAVNPFVIALYGMPKILVLPWIMLFLGFGATPAVVYATIHGVFPILVLVTGAVRDVDATLVTVARAFGARRWQLYWKVVLPAIVPTVLAGMRLGVVFCLLGVLVVEMFAGLRGMGYVLSSLANGFPARRHRVLLRVRGSARPCARRARGGSGRDLCRPPARAPGPARRGLARAQLHRPRRALAHGADAARYGVLGSRGARREPAAVPLPRRRSYARADVRLERVVDRPERGRVAAGGRGVPRRGPSRDATPRGW